MQVSNKNQTEEFMALSESARKQKVENLMEQNPKKVAILLILPKKNQTLNSLKKTR